jgi:hypothetical protein
MARMSNRDRIARAAEEARLAAAEKAAKKVAKKPSKSRSKSAAPPARMKIVWEVWRSPGTTIKTFAYPHKAEAEAAVAELTSSTGVPHNLRATKVPME